MTSLKICSLGSINLDFIVQTHCLPTAGKTIGGGTFETHPGGKGANVALAAKKMGAYTTLLGAVGNDEFAVKALDLLKKSDVDLKSIVVLDDVSTGVAFINVDEDGENQIAVASGANKKFSPEHIGIIDYDGIITQFEIPLETIFEAIKNYKGFVAINPSPVLDGLDKLLPYASVIIVNEGEYQAYKETLRSYTGLLAVTHGAQGAVLIKNNIVLASVKPPHMNAIDTTGAGDCFAAALSISLMEGKSYEEALEFACAAGALVTQKVGTQPAMPSRPEIEKLSSTF